MADKAAQTVRDELGTCVPEEVRDYAADTAAGLLDDLAGEDADTIATEMHDALGPLLEGIEDSAVQALCKKIARAFKGLDGDGTTGGDGAAEEGHEWLHHAVEEYAAVGSI